MNSYILNNDELFQGLYGMLRHKNVHRENIMIKQELLDIIACPKCKGSLQLNEKKDGLICQTCSLIYEIRDDIPIMLIDEARPLKKHPSEKS